MVEHGSYCTQSAMSESGGVNLQTIPETGWIHLSLQTKLCIDCEKFMCPKRLRLGLLFSKNNLYLSFLHPVKTWGYVLWFQSLALIQLQQFESVSFEGTQTNSEKNWSKNFIVRYGLVQKYNSGNSSRLQRAEGDKKHNLTFRLPLQFFFFCPAWAH